MHKKTIKKNGREFGPYLSKLIKKGESETLEFKQSLSDINRIVETACSFANKKGGVVLIGVDKNSSITGVQSGKDTIERLTNKIVDNTDYHIYPSISTVLIGDKNVIVAEIKESERKPILAFGRAFIRIGKNTKQMGKNEYDSIVKKQSEQEFDYKVCEGASYDDINEQAVSLFRRKYEKESSKKIISSNKELLKSIGCIKESKITNAGILLFGKNPAEFFPRYYISIARYPGRDIGTAYLEIKDIEGNLFEVIDKSEKYIKEHTETFHMLKEGQVAREPVPQYPDFVIRELIVNAVAHRDYSIRGSKNMIKMFRDRIEFDSPGGFPGNVNEKNILHMQFSRNPNIVKVLNKVRYIEEMGEGWNRIIDIMKNYPLKFTRMPGIEGNSRVVVTLYPPEVLESTREKTTPKTTPKTTQKILSLLREHPEMTREELAESLGITPDGVKYHIHNLKKRGLLKRLGGRKGGRWEVQSND